MDITDSSTGFSEHRTYDILGNIATRTRTIKGKPYETDYTIDAFGRMRTLTLPDKEVITYNYDVGGLLKSVTGSVSGSNTTYVSDIKYNEYGQRTSITYGNGVLSSYTYDSNERLSALSTSFNGISYQNIKYGYDPVGNITDKTQSAFTTLGANTLSAL